MTTHLLPSGPARGDLAEPTDDHGPSPVGRWVLHRAGIVNVWQYDRVELRFAGGRLLLRGKNGAGKSKALEILLPFLLDGDTRALDATGRDRTTVRWLMTEGRANGHHLGYVWLELRCVDDDGVETFQTLGAGLKASTAAGRADSWFFLTDRRVGIDLDLDVAGECLSIERLKDALGDDAVTASGAEHRRRVGRHVFGLFDEARYRNLLHLLHALRDPNIGNQVEAGELARVLSAALPPIDERVLTEAAGHFDDLEAIRDQVDRSARTALALGQFLGDYRRYTRTALSRRAVAVEQAEASRARAVRVARQLSRAVDEAGSAAARAEETLAAHRRERTDREAERRELERSEGYRAHQDLVDRQERATALEVAAEAAESAADRAGVAHQRAVADLASAGDDVRRSLVTTGEAATTVAGLAAESGLEPTLLGPPPATGTDNEIDSSGLLVADERARAAHTLVEGRRRRAGEVRDLARQAERAGQEATGADERAAASEAEVDHERAQVAEARSARVAAEQAWAGAVDVWTTTGSASALGVSWHSVHAALTVRREETTWVTAVRRAVADALASPLREARQVATEADLAEARAAESLAATEARLADIEAQSEARPGASRFRDAERDPASGAPFYELVDIAAGVAPDDAAGLEAALEAAGLLDAWVSADGLVVHPGTHDTLLRTGGASFPAEAATLADVLVPAAADGSPVRPETVAALLRAVGLDDQPDVESWVSVGGRWALGVARGAWRKDTVEFLGAGARRATRERLLEELRIEVARTRAEVAEAAARAGVAAHRRDALEGLPATLPSADAIDEAEQEVRTAERILAAARARHDADRRRAEHARATANRLAAVVAHEALGDSLPVTVGDLDRLLSVLADLRNAVADHRRALHDLTREAQRLGTRRREEADRRAEAAATAAEAGQRRADHDVAAHELATLRQALAATVDAVLAHHAEVTARLAEVEHVLLPAADQARRQADAGQATAAARLEEAVIVEDRARSVLIDAGDALGAAVALPGVLLAATGLDLQQLGGVDPPGDADRARAGVALAAAVAPLVDGDDEVSDGTILSRYDRLSEALPGGYDTAIDEHDGVKVVHVADDSGRQTLAVVAARLADEAEAARSRLAAREREVLERFLLRELADEVRSKLLDALDLVAGANRTLAGVSTSHGKGAHLDWRLRDDAAAPAGVAARLLVDELRDEAADAELRDTLLALIDAERAADPSAGYEQHLRAALDYRGWHRFTVKVTDSAHPGSSRVLSSRLGLSQGEQRVLSYLALFAAAASHFEAIARDTPTAPRLLLLDDAFAKVDEPTHGHLLGLLVRLELDFVLTSERMWGCFPSVPSLEIYEAVRDPALPGIALVHFRWDGHQRHLVGV